MVIAEIRDQPDMSAAKTKLRILNERIEVVHKSLRRVEEAPKISKKWTRTSKAADLQAFFMFYAPVVLEGLLSQNLQELASITSQIVHLAVLPRPFTDSEV